MPANYSVGGRMEPGDIQAEPDTDEADREEDRAWLALATAGFFRDDAEEDAIYDQFDEIVKRREERVMRIPVLIEQVEANGYRASGSAPFNFSVEAESREAALERFRERVKSQLASGAEIVQVEIDVPEPPYARFAGTWTPGDPRLEQWKKNVEEYRREVDGDPTIP
jgi:hypothetical protein